MRYLMLPRERKPAELLLVPMIDIFTVLVTFLLMTAVFSRIAIMQIDLPSSAPAKPEEAKFRLEVIVRQDGFEVSDGKQLIASIPKVNGAYDLNALNEQALAAKREHPTAEDASVLSEPRVPYDGLIQAMDAIRSAELPGADALVGGGAAALGRAGTPAVPAPQTAKVALFSNIALGDAP
ncbi:MAG TPA: biopolymer transporter ExbD [Steroidobacteraceae bacterium]|nr:biopolymer transporter ExbD [Steroidobacteraceae bacterium]